MSPQAHSQTYYGEELEFYELLQEAKKCFYRAVITMENPVVTNGSGVPWASYDIHLTVQEEENGPWKIAARIYKKGGTLPKMTVSFFEADANAWSQLRDTLLMRDEERKKKLQLQAGATSPSSASPLATQMSASSSQSSAGSSSTQERPSTLAPAQVTAATPSPQATKPLAAFASTTVLDSIKQPQP